MEAGKAKIESLTASQLVELSFQYFPDTFRKELAPIIRQSLQRFPIAERATLLSARPPGRMDKEPLEGVVEDVLTGLLPEHADDAVSLMKRYGTNAEQFERIVSKWAETDMEGALKFWSKLGDAPSHIAKIYIPLAKRDLAQAKKVALGLTDERLRQEVIAEVATVMAGEDLMGAVKWAHENGRVNFSNKLSNSGPAGKVFERMAKLNPRRAADCLAQNIPFFIIDDGPCRSVFQTWAEQDYAAANEWLKQNPLPDALKQSALFDLFHRGIEKMTASQAVDAWKSQPTSQQHSAIFWLTSKLVKEDPEWALSTLKSLSIPTESVQKGLIDIIRLRSPKREFFLAHMEDIIPLFEKDPEILDSARNLTKEERATLLTKLSPATQTAYQKLELTRLQDRYEYDAAMELISNMGVEGQRVGDIATLATKAAEVLPSRVAEWVTGLPECENRSYAALNLVMSWAKTDPDAAEAWATKLLPGATKDKAFQELVRVRAMLGETAKAVELAALITDPKNQIPAYGQALQGLWNQDFVTAKAMLGKFELDEVTRTGLEIKLTAGSFAMTRELPLEQMK